MSATPWPLRTLFEANRIIRRVARELQTTAGWTDNDQRDFGHALCEGRRAVRSIAHDLTYALEWADQFRLKAQTHSTDVEASVRAFTIKVNTTRKDIKLLRDWLDSNKYVPGDAINRPKADQLEAFDRVTHAIPEIAPWAWMPSRLNRPARPSPPEYQIGRRLTPPRLLLVPALRWAHLS